MTVHSNIGKIAALLDDTVEDAVNKGARTIAATAQANVVEDTGGLRDSIHVEPASSGHGEIAYRVIASPTTKPMYGSFVEFGTRKSAPKPFLTPAYERHKRDVESAIDEAIERLAERHKAH